MLKRLYLDVHILQTVPPANLNRDDQGNPKEAMFGGVRRARVSSQAWKRATRKEFAEKVPQEELATRTRRVTAELTRRLAARTDLQGDAAARVAGALLAPLGIKAGKKEGDTAYLLFYGNRQLETIVDLVADQAAELAEATDDALAAAVKDLPIADKLTAGHPIDVALFGRMVADIPTLNVDAATQVAHALSTHAADLEFDYFTAVDDKNEKGETGAGMIGTIGFNSATLYRYATLGLHQLHDNLGNLDATLEAVELFLASFARAMPTGHGNSFAHRTLPTLLTVVARRDQPVNLVSAFERPVVSTEGIAAESALRLAREHQRATQQWGDEPTYTAVTHTLDPDTRHAIAVTEAFGTSQRFGDLLTGLRAHLVEHTKQA
ncbi:type I-E CRISPR-associated protein Cas7/Cse4/CasC [Actinomadura kijaniata]|uniref:type I-E CRISPR-associated protein Cas7/Cse4/CasC n=1 Tax=Actinomadura kijaniata TaxID=46161 RepID=UPI00082CD447|nr:type I-E CRISPR-associated protein Cas7/Cse4/CasC [Actinomadura kijaniata]